VPDEYQIAVCPGDGIGVEVTAEVVKVLCAVERRFGVNLRLTEFDWGGRHWERTGTVVPDDFLQILRPFDAIFLGAVGDPGNLPDHITLVPLIRIRQSFDQYVCLRPAKLFAGVPTPLEGKSPGSIDMVIVRENSEGEYTDAGGIFKHGKPHELSLQTAIHTRVGVERILRHAFNLARGRRKHLTMATKSNAMKFSMVMWDEILADVARQFPDVQSEKCHVDALAMNFVRRPESYDVVVATNLFGDILSDLSSVITGSLGLAPSANINPEREYPSLFEPVHGSAPDIAGKGIANPLAAIRSAAMMLDFLGERDAAVCIEESVASNLSDSRMRTADLGGAASTAEVGDDIALRI